MSRMLAALPAVLLLSLLSGCALLDRLRPVSTDTQLEDAIVAGDWQQVIDRCKAWHARDPRDPVPASVASQASDCLPRSDDKHALWRSLSTGTDPRRTDPRLRLRAWADALVKRHPNSARALYVAAYLLVSCTDNDAALERASAAVKLDPKDPEAWMVRGLVYTRADKPDLALPDFDQSLRLDPANVHLLAYRGSTYFALADYRRARADFDAALAASPHYLYALQWRATLANVGCRFDACLRDLDEALRLQSEDGGLYDNRASVRDVLGDADGARADAGKALDLLKDARSQSDYDHYASALVVVGDYEPAVRLATSAINADPRDFNAYSIRSAARLRDGSQDRAVADAASAINLRPTFPTGYDLRGLAYLVGGQTDLALRDFEHEIAMAPEMPRGYVGRGFVHEVRGETAAAQLDFDHATKLSDGGSRKLVDFDRRTFLHPTPSPSSPTGQLQ